METYREFKRDLCWGIGGLFVAMLLLDLFRVGYDSTDSGQRSGLGLYTDALTGCQYLSAGPSGITPRLDRDGAHICTPTPPTSEGGRDE